MKRILLFRGFLAVLASAFVISGASADTFGSGANQFTIDFVTIGNPGNPPDDDPNPAGAVDYTYRMGKYEVSEQMIDNANALGGLGITKDTRGPDKPATSVTWYEAARFVNWLNTSSGSVPAYKFDDARRVPTLVAERSRLRCRTTSIATAGEVLPPERRRVAQGGVLRSSRRSLLGLPHRKRRDPGRDRLRRRSGLRGRVL